jgi:xanthine dehydrogenase accessory factor
MGSVPGEEDDMLELAERLLAAIEAHGSVAVATVTDVLGSAPRTVGTSMALADGRVLGSISGGCVEGAAVDACERVIASGSAETARFGFTDDDAFAVGLTCGGELDVVVAIVGSESVVAELAAASQGAEAGIAVVVSGPEALLGRTVAALAGRDLPGDMTASDLAAAGLPSVSIERVRGAVDASVEAGRTGSVTVECGSEALTLLVESQVAAPRLFLIGAVEFAAALAAAARPLGYRIIVCDARPMFATPERFPAAHEVIAEWPQLYLAGQQLAPHDVVCVLSHDDRFDVPVLKETLESPARYVGALGSRRTHERRIAALELAGVSSENLQRLHSPIGLDLGASTPEETALSILAEVLASRTGGTGLPLRDLAGPIHQAAREELRL